MGPPNTDCGFVMQMKGNISFKMFIGFIMEVILLTLSWFYLASNPYGRPNRRGDDRFDRGRRGGGGGGHRGRGNNRGDGGGDGRNTWFKIFVSQHCE